MTAVMLQRKQADNERMSRLHELQERVLVLPSKEKAFSLTRPILTSSVRDKADDKQAGS